VPLHYAGVRGEGRHRFDLLQLRPPNGRELTLWIDQGTHQPARVVEHDPVKGDSTIFFSDYRRVQGFWFPFKQRQSTADPGTEIVMDATEVRALSQVPDSVFSLPSTTSDDALLLGGRSETHIPFTLRYGQIVVPVSLDGSDPLPFVIDSSGISSLTPATAKLLRLSASGHLPVYGVGERPVQVGLTHVSKLRLGDAQLNAQLFQVLPLPRSITYLGRDAPLAGLLGYELFRRFQVTIDYQRRELTLALPSPEPPALLSGNLRSSLPAQRLMLKFYDGLPYVLGTVDGVPGYFGVDTGDNSGLTLFGHFYALHRFPVELPGLVSSEEGVGGATATFMTRVATLSFGDLTLERPLTQLTFASSGAFAEDRSAGNLGSLILQNFVVTLDFAFRYLYLQPSVQFGQSMAYNRSGLYLRLDRTGIPVIAAVLPGSPAALSGLQVGDLLLQVDQQPQRGRDYYDITALFEQQAGTRLQLQIARHGKREGRTLILREMLPSDVDLQPMVTIPPLRPIS
jgi:hypothetical protein